ncbi:hypothetical protein LWI29_019987 [Acer saccharum]|uniref:Strictosidine synthase conserved region domain-containing protein n=1 Tax=Acer saccharum TaxID=4024 RepID=A0AA39TFV6_ACESA|nr:hypothetical protein LWI29_019987 [Acer saccharum]
MPIEENTIEQYTPGTFEEDESQQSPRIEMDEEYIEGYRNFEKLLAEFVNKLEGHQMDFNTSFYEQLLSFGDLIVSEWPWSDGGIESIWKEITHALLKVLPEELRQHNYVTLTLMEADVITTFSEALEIILDYDDHRVRRNLRKHAVSSMGPDLKTQKRYDHASCKYNLKDYIFDVLEGKPHGRFMRFDPKTKTTWALVLDIYFANGVAISPDQAYVVFCETIMYGEGVKSITSKVRNPGSVDKFIDDLPGVPENIHYDG